MSGGPDPTIRQRRRLGRDPDGTPSSGRVRIVDPTLSAVAWFDLAPGPVLHRFDRTVDGVVTPCLSTLWNDPLVHAGTDATARWDMLERDPISCRFGRMVDTRQVVVDVSLETGVLEVRIVIDGTVVLQAMLDDEMSIRLPLFVINREDDT